MPRVEVCARSFVLCHPCGHEQQRVAGVLMPCAECTDAPTFTVEGTTFDRLPVLSDPKCPGRRIHTWAFVVDCAADERLLADPLADEIRRELRRFGIEREIDRRAREEG